MPETPSYDYESIEKVPQEPWDYDVFVAEYNNAAGKRFHHYVPDSVTEHLQHFYETSKNDYKTIKEFAILQLEHEQVYTDDVLDKYRD